MIALFQGVQPHAAATVTVRSAPLRNQVRTLGHALASGQLDFMQFGLERLVRPLLTRHSSEHSLSQPVPACRVPSVASADVTSARPTFSKVGLPVWRCMWMSLGIAGISL